MSSGFTLSRFSLATDERPSLDQFVLLSAVLHVLVVILFGDTTGGGVRRGEKLWGAFTVTVQGLMTDSAVGLKLDRSTTLMQSRREMQPVPASPGIPSTNREARVSTPAEIPQPAEEVAPSAPAPAFEMPPVISTDVEKAVTEFVVPKPSSDRVYAQPTPAPPVVAPAPLPVTPPRVEGTIVPPVPVVVPVESRSRIEAIATPIPAPPPEAEMPVLAAPDPKPREVVTPIVQPVQPDAPAPTKPARQIVPPVVSPAEPQPREIPAPAPVAQPALSEPPARTEAPAAPKIEREVVKAAAPPAASVAAPAAPPTTPVGKAAADRDLLKPGIDATTPSTDALAPALGKAPGLDLDAVRRRAREISSGGTGPRTVFPFPGTPPQKPKSKEQQAFDKALKKNDCRDAYADMGLAAVVPLVLSAVREDGCKW